MRMKCDKQSEIDYGKPRYQKLDVSAGRGLMAYLWIWTIAFAALGMWWYLGH